MPLDPTHGSALRMHPFCLGCAVELRYSWFIHPKWVTNGPCPLVAPGVQVQASPGLFYVGLPSFGLVHQVSCRRHQDHAISGHPMRKTNVFRPLRKAVLPVAGLGTRFLPATKSMPKEMLTVVDRPLIQYAVDEARAAGIEQFCLVTGRGKTTLVEQFDIAFELEAVLKERNKHQGTADPEGRCAAAGLGQQRPPAGAARPRPCHLVRPRLHRRRPVRHPAARRPGAVGSPACTAQLADGLQGNRRQRGRGDRSAARAHQPLRHPRHRHRRRPAGRGSRPGGKTRSGAGTLQPVHHRPLRAAARGDRPSGAWRAWAPATRSSSPTAWPR